ncbi:heme ABC exporter ATP-binding protein CcmA [Aquabacter cavernae]|uniref:heme ABC exporter ATP-binding protein CcmA n=1 Tax=Aquabacter cavernae TaxID=2496029 RepID=UPI000F8E6309|nr:heme ABC exporter ATP-binding protein CcmA [Aquabacter cavernae]
MCIAPNAGLDDSWSGLAFVGESLACRRGTRLLFENLSFSVRSGEALVVTGANGVGKSSLLRLAAGLLTATSGRARLEGDAADTRMSERTHYLGHDDALKASLTVRENLGFWRAVLGSQGLPVEDALDEVGLGGLGRLPAMVLSAGQKRRLAIARLLVSRRPLWVLDEPTTALDAQAQARFAALGRTHLQAGGLILAATHTPLDFGPGARELRLGAPR